MLRTHPLTRPPRHPALRLATLLLCVACAPFASAQADEHEPSTPEIRATDGLPANADYDASIPWPASVFGWQPGRWHVRPEQIAEYFRALDASSSRMQLIETGRTHEGRPLYLAAISSEANMQRLDELRRAHVRTARAGEPPAANAPVFVWLGYSVHGNEPSGANASSIVAHHLVADRSADTLAMLDEMVVLVDPMLNPDGLARFAHWANMHQGKVRVASADHREHREPWPSGRTNHYWFDLNRDWLPLVHPESRGRVEQFQRWLPNVLTDHHEMGTNSTFFFQPGVPSRGNPHTPPRNLELTRALAKHHAAALDGVGELFYSEESFDDFYYGKGSTYPDVNGAVGILFEQASSRGHLQENASGELSFERTIRNQVLTSFSTLRGALENKRALLEWQSEFYATAADTLREAGIGGWVFGASDDRRRSRALVEVLLQHAIEVHLLTSDLEVDGQLFQRDGSYFVPAAQAQARLAHALFERPREFADETFYDVSAWTLPLAFGVPAAEVGVGEVGELGQPFFNAALNASQESPAQPWEILHAARGFLDEDSQSDFGYALRWGGLHAPRTLSALLHAGVRVRVATRPFHSVTHEGEQDFEPGTLFIPVRQPEHTPDELFDLLSRQCSSDETLTYALDTGLTPDGIDLGSPSMLPIDAPTVALIVDGSASSYEAGELWHEIDLRWNYPVLLLESDSISARRLEDVDVLLAPSGALSGLSGSARDASRDWVRGGGTLVALRSSATWAAREWLELDDDKRDTKPASKRRGGGDSQTDHADDDATSNDEATTADNEDSAENHAPPRYIDYESERAKGLVSGVFFASTIDNTHPLGFGFADGTLATFRSGTHRLPTGDDPFAAAAVYTSAPLLAGYGGPEAVKKLASSAAVLGKRFGSGSLVLLADDPVFRGFAHGSARLLANAVFFGKLIKRTGKLEAPEDEAQEASAAHH
ncbi:MAG: peptidase M14 [Planctomycetota bacterium]|nr:MAG: peptidase M14 [Planctomycetota bacterium]